MIVDKVTFEKKLRANKLKGFEKTTIKDLRIDEDGLLFYETTFSSSKGENFVFLETISKEQFFFIFKNYKLKNQVLVKKLFEERKNIVLFNKSCDEYDFCILFKNEKLIKESLNK
jgi:hypothetical protein